MTQDLPGVYCKWILVFRCSLDRVCNGLQRRVIIITVVSNHNLKRIVFKCRRATRLAEFVSDVGIQVADDELQDFCLWQDMQGFHVVGHCHLPAIHLDLYRVRQNTTYGDVATSECKVYKQTTSGMMV